jgi:hypothetical protein
MTGTAQRLKRRSGGAGGAADDPQKVIADLRRQLDARTVERDQALAREAAKDELLQLINSSPGDLAPVFEAMLDKAINLSEAVYGHVLTYDGEFLNRVAVRGEPHLVGQVLQRRRPEEAITRERLVRGERMCTSPM